MMLVPLLNRALCERKNDNNSWIFDISRTVITIYNNMPLIALSIFPFGKVQCNEAIGISLIAQIGKIIS